MLACNSNIYFLLYIRLSSMTFKFTYEKSHYTYSELWKHEKVVGVVEVVVGVESKVRVARTLNVLGSKKTIFFSGSSNFKAKNWRRGLGGGGDGDHPLGSSILCNGTDMQWVQSCLDNYIAIGIHFGHDIRFDVWWRRISIISKLLSWKSLHIFWLSFSATKNTLNSSGRYNNNRYGVEERVRKQALPFIENKLPKQNQYTTK